MGDKIKITNFMIEKFHRDISFKKLQVATELSQEFKFKLFKMFESMLNSKEARALAEAKNALIEASSDSKELAFDHPKVTELMELDSGIELEKLIMSVKDIPHNFTLEDMMVTSWLIEFKDE